jgi:DNA polymerase III alpha subunit
MAELEPDAQLPPMPPGERVIEDYRHLRLSLNAHPVSFLRGEFEARGVVANERLTDIPSGRRVTVAGLVLVRQRPGIGNVIFMTLEDETAIANTIVWMRVFERFRPIVLGARLVSVTGVLQNEQGVIHIVAEKFEDLTPLLRRLSDDGACIDPASPTDEVKRPSQGSWRRHPRQGDALVTMLKEKPAVEDLVTAENTAQVMPKGRNFH